ncbi:hypothetical protein NDA14_007568 [Ustilago hordei]|uniref:SWI5-dependent HO expression protein 3 n=1 Tax=Ustilago hordei TaxID=120017 RepID=I2FXM9_USTHO|nr:uncharacterized protein UHO2_00121 [Ustilago hordei]KAJ1043554.1 hypothetical protein NDA10_007455 [Ustilago hordei]KAJ1587315.1 hypothetical protein NDA15_004371 [Ustilago hordei]KAJ1590461.1 hypothetical protein NDA12_007496 [Ustilago hordei]KAJ1602643.1 hypothetical protein NDA14_007568 [Ustilago hordei]CCF51672.1 uncharacterized protein UHOR_08415 [Ustilago hordei]
MAAIRASSTMPAPKASTSSEAAPCSVPFKSRKTASCSSADYSRQSYSPWLLIDIDDTSFPFIRTLHTHPEAPLASGSTSPAACSTEKLTESTNTTASKPSVKSQAIKYENGLIDPPSEANAAPRAAEKDRRMSLSHHPARGASTARRGFMSRLRGAGGSVSGASVFSSPNPAANGAQMSSSGSWNMVDPPTPIKEHPTPAAVSGAMTVHLAFTSSATKAAIENAEGLVARAASSTLLSAPAAQTDQLRQEFHRDRLEPPALAELVNRVKPEAIFIGTAHTGSIQPHIEALLSPPSSSLKTILLDPVLVRTLTPASASTLHDLARSKQITTSLPIRWSSLWTPNVEETLFGLELLHEVQQEQSQSLANGNGDANADGNVEKSFDVSMSNIPTGLSDKNLVELGRMKGEVEVERFKRELAARDARIAGLAKQVEDQRTAAVAAKQVVDPRTPDRARAAPTLEPIASSVVETPVAPAPAPAPASSVSDALSIPTTAQPLASLSQQQRSNTATPAATLAPTRTITTTAKASLGSGLALSPASQTRSPSGTGKVLSHLTTELELVKTQLSSTLSSLTLARSQGAQFQAQAEEMRCTLSRARLENDSSITILARKDRQISEALERARKAESEAKELGRASREWGTRVREVEEELGKERIKRMRAEQSYEALSSEWKGARDRLVGEVRELKEQHVKSVTQLSKEYEKVLIFKDRLKEEFGYTKGNHASGSSKMIEEIKGLNAKMQAYLNQQLQPLLERQKALEKRESQEIVERLKYLTDELTRYKTLMRSGDVTDESQVPPLKEE